MSPRILLSAALRALPVVGPLLRRLDRLEIFILLHESELDLLLADRLEEIEPAAVRQLFRNPFLTGVQIDRLLASVPAPSNAGVR